MQVAVAHDRLNQRAGSERVAMEIARIFDSPIYTGEYDPEGTFKRLEAMEVHDLNGLPESETSFLYPLVRMWDAKKFMELELPQDVIFASGQWAHFVSLSNSKVIHYCHTPPRFLYDLHDRVKEMYAHPLKEFFRMWTSYWEPLDQKAAQEVDEILVNSENVRRRVRRYYGREATVVNPPVDTDKFHFKEFGDFFLSVNRLTPFKRVDIQLDAFEALDENLVIVGETEKMGGYQREIRERIEEMDNVRLEENVNDWRLAKLYSSCKATIQTAESEDWGYSPAESMASGKPCLAVNEGGFRETIKDGETGILIDEPYAENLAREIRNFDPSDFDPGYLQEYAEKFSEDSFEEKIRKLAETA